MFAWICPKCGKEIPPQYDGCPEWCPEYSKQKAYLKTSDRPLVEATSPIIKNLAQLEGQQANVYSPGAPPPPPRVEPEEPPPGNGPRIRPAAVAVTYEEGVPEYVPGGREPGREAAPPVTIAPNVDGGKRELNPLLVTVLAAIVFVALGYAGFKYYERSKGTPGASSNMVAAGGTQSGHPLNRALSVTGLRFVPGKNNKLEARFLIVNNTGAQTPKFSGIVSVRPKDAAADETPLLTFELKGVELGPYESREMQAPLHSSLKPYELPDGGLVRADLNIVEPAAD
ncbi:MAG: hypothetical protein IT170_02680 [Bryobacterales bacterium]|nr:hypothetical protein [Bryobacterales bacterium]